MIRRGVLAAAGAVLLLTASVALPTLVVPTLEKVPQDPDVTTVLEAPGARILDVETQRTVSRDLVLTSHTEGFEAAGDPPDGVVVWSTNAHLASTDGVVRSDTWEIQALDSRTGEASDCCEDFRVVQEGRSEPVSRAGVVAKFPFGTEQKDLQVWDAALGATVTARFEGVDDVDGVEAYRFSVVVPPTDVGSADVPSSILGISSVAEVPVRQVYSGERTVWVEPATGGILDLRQQVRQVLAGAGEEVVALDATFVLSEDSRADSVRQLSGGVHLARMHDVYPAVLGIGGAALLGLALARRRRARPVAPAVV